MKKHGQSTSLCDRLLNLVIVTKETREAFGIVPTFITRIHAVLSLNASRKQIDAAAKQLEEEGKIRIGDTVRDKYYELITK